MRDSPGGLPYKNDGVARHIFQGLKTLFPPVYLSGCAASKGPQQEILRNLLGY